MANDGSSRPRRAHKPSSMLWSAGDDGGMNRKRAASDAAAALTRSKIAQLFGLSLAQAAERVGVRHSPRAGLRAGWGHGRWAQNGGGRARRAPTRPGSLADRTHTRSRLGEIGQQPRFCLWARYNPHQRSLGHADRADALQEGLPAGGHHELAPSQGRGECLEDQLRSAPTAVRRGETLAQPAT